MILNKEFIKSTREYDAYYERNRHYNETNYIHTILALVVVDD